MTKAFNLLILITALAGCAGSTPSPSDGRNPNDRPLPPGEGALGNAFTWEFRKKDAPPPAASAPANAPAATPAQAGAATPSGSASERQEFEEWRAWQEWKRKNAK